MVAMVATGQKSPKVPCAQAARLQIQDLEADLEEALSTNPGANLRLRIKRLCVKYHPDHGVTKLSSAEVACDLVDLLSD